MVGRYNDEMVDRLRERWLEDDRSESCGCCKCGDEAILDIGGELYCEDCGKEEYSEYTDDVYCEVCGEECPDVYYRVGNEVYCGDCFVEVYQV